MNTPFDYFTYLESILKLALQNALLAAVTAVLGASCASAPPTIVHEVAGPAFAAINQEHNGFLAVYSATEWTTNDDGPAQLTYSAYQVDSIDGSLFKEVANGDWEPTRVTLPKGTYTVMAWSDTAGEVSVPVTIETGRTTVLHLEQEKDWKIPAGVRSADLVRLPNGQPIGFRARPAESRQGPVMTVAQLQRPSRVMGN